MMQLTQIYRVRNMAMLKFLLILLPAFIVAPLASAQIYKCVGKGGLDLYQNFPCAIDSLGWMPMDPLRQNAPSPASNVNPELTKAATPPVVEAGTLRSPEAVPRVGMTTDQVRRIWGEPTGDAIHSLVPIWHTEIGDEPIEIWSYGTTRSVQFDQNGRVSVLRR
jgi:hypothetical protein